MSKDFEAAVGMSRKWDAREAGREVAESAIRKLHQPPDFFLLFSTIHFEQHGGFQEFLNGVWEVLPEGTPLIGGTVAGFMNNYGCFTRGATALACSYSKMDISIGIGHDTKKNPKKAAHDCAVPLKEAFEKSQYENEFIFQMVSGATIPHFPGVGGTFIFKGKFRSTIAAKLIELSTRRLQKGIGREEEVLEELSKIMSKSDIISGSALDAMNLSSNYQFFRKNVYTNASVVLGFKTDRSMEIKYNHGFHKMNTEPMEITEKTFGGKIIKKINNEDAVKVFLRSINWSEDMLDERLHRKTFFFPLGFEYADRTLAPSAIGAILGGGFSFSYKTEAQDLYVLTASGKSIINGIESCVNSDAPLAFGISCCANLVTLGDDIYYIQERIKKNLKDFLIIFTLGEGVFLAEEQIPKFFNETSVIMSMT